MPIPPFKETESKETAGIVDGSENILGISINASFR
jgi:hypothetical protein